MTQGHVIHCSESFLLDKHNVQEPSRPANKWTKEVCAVSICSMHLPLIFAMNICLFNNTNDDADSGDDCSVYV